MSDKQDNEFYPTPPELCLAIVRKLDEVIPKPRRIIEPSAGMGPFIRAAKQVWPEVFAMGVDIDPRIEAHMRDAGADRVAIGDWEEVIRGQKNLDVLILGNDPFTLQVAHVMAGLEAQGHGTYQAKVSRASLLESRERIPFWESHPARYVLPLVPRPNFMKGMVDPVTKKKKGGDNSAYMLYIWQKGYRGRAELFTPLVWK